MIFVAVIEIVVPIALLAAVVTQRAPGPWQFLLGALAMGMGIFFMWLVFPWGVTSVYLRTLVPLLYLFAVILGFRRIGTKKGDPPARWQQVLNAVINLAVLVFFTGLVWRVILGYPAPEGSIKLVSPLRDGQFIVGHGGASPFINGHYHVTPQNHALDLLGLNVAGARRNLLSDPRILENYTIFGKPIYSPCDGRVLVTVDALEDLAPGKTDRENLAGNYVLIQCQGAEVVLAHMKQGSVRVSAGQQVTTQTQIGQVGNSGNTSEPHLHIHAEKGGSGSRILDGEAVPMLIDGRYLVRGDTL